MGLENLAESENEYRVVLIFAIVALCLIYRVIIAGITSVVASRKGLPKGGWFCLSFFLIGIIALIIVACLPERRQKFYVVNSGNMVVKEKTRADAWVCAGCGKVNDGGTFCNSCGAERVCKRQ